MMTINGYDTELGFDNMLINPNPPVQVSVSEREKSSAFFYLHAIFHSTSNRRKGKSITDERFTSLVYLMKSVSIPNVLYIQCMA